MTFNVFLSFSLSLGLHNNQRVLLMPFNLKSFCHNRFVHGEQIDFSQFTPSLGNCTRGVISESHHRLCFFPFQPFFPECWTFFPGFTSPSSSLQNISYFTGRTLLTSGSNRRSCTGRERAAPVEDNSICWGCDGTDSTGQIPRPG